MKKTIKKKKGLIKGTPVAVLVSIGIHALLIFFAIGWVVFKFITPEPPVFVPPEKINRPTMKLKKPQVVVKDNSKPKQSTERIVSKANLTTANIVLPQMTAGGIGDGLGDAVGGFQMMEDLAKMTLMGGETSLGNDLVGTFYYFMRSRSGGPSEFKGRPDELYKNLVKKFLDSGWDPSVFDHYWRAPTKLYATQFFIPGTNSGIAPDKFGFKDRSAMAAYWLCHYKGKIGFPKELIKDYPDGARFRFWAYGDNVLFIRINGEMIIDASMEGRNYNDNLIGWRGEDVPENRIYPVSSNGGLPWRVSEWFEMTPDEPTDMEIIFGEQPGGGFMSVVCIQQEGVEYPDREKLRGPLLPIFKTAPMPQHIVDEISYYMPEGAVDITGGPIFSTY